MRRLVSLRLRLVAVAGAGFLAGAAADAAPRVTLPRAEPLYIDHAMPDQVRAGEWHSILFLIKGGNPSGYLFSVENAPAFMTWSEDGWVTLTPGAGDEGEYSGIRFTVWDGHTLVESEPFSLRVARPEGE